MFFCQKIEIQDGVKWFLKKLIMSKVLEQTRSEEEANKTFFFLRLFWLFFNAVLISKVSWSMGGGVNTLGASGEGSLPSRISHFEKH